MGEQPDLLPAVWVADDEGWRLERPGGFGDERALHQLVADAPQLLPLSGQPDLVVLGSEVRLGSGYADLLAVEASGRPVLIEVKLAYNAEARRAVVAQVLAYAAELRGLTFAELERDVLRGHLNRQGHASIWSAVQELDQAGAIDEQRFRDAFEAALADGRFRLVFVLDSVPRELVRLVGYLEAVSELVIDLVSVSRYDIEGRAVLVPQRIDPGREDARRTDGHASARTATGEAGELLSGSEAFAEAIDSANAAEQPRLQQLLAWAHELREAGYVTLATYRGASGRLTLLPRLIDERVGLVTIWNERGRAYLQFWRSVFERRAPDAIAEVERFLSPGDRLGQGTSTSELTGELLDAIASAYQHAARAEHASAVPEVPTEDAPAEDGGGPARDS